MTLRGRYAPLVRDAELRRPLHGRYAAVTRPLRGRYAPLVRDAELRRPHADEARHLLRVVLQVADEELHGALVRERVDL